MKILIAEDDSVSRVVLGGILAKWGHEVVVACDGRQACDAFVCAEPPRIALLDWMMPELDGLEVCRKVRETPGLQAVYIIMLTAKGQREDMLAAFGAGADDFLVKPYDREELGARLRVGERIIALQTQLTARAAEALRQSEQRYRWLVEHSSDITGVLDRDGRVTFVSPSVERVLGYTTGEIQGMNAFALAINPEDIARLRELFQRLVDRPDTPATAEFRFQHKDGSWRTLESVGNNFLDNPEVAGVLLNLRDVTEKKNLEARFLRAQRMESIGVLAAGIAHELNNVLTPILLMIDVLRARLPDESGQRILDTVQGSAQRGAGLIRHLLAFARGAEGQRIAVQPQHLIQELEKVARETYPKSIRIEVAVPDTLWEIFCDPSQLQQALMNICVNAREAMPEGGRLEITAENIELDASFCSQETDARPGPYVAIGIADTGSGMPPPVLGRIFEPFFTTKEAAKRTGLGLATVLGIVKGHEGFVKVRSRVGEGTRFTIYLPAQTTAVTPRDRSVAVEPLPAHGELVLVVDDEATVREMTGAALESKGFTVLTAGDGTEAVACYAEHGAEIAVVLTDMAMPFMDGRATIRALRKINPQVRVVAVSGLEQEANLAQVGDGVLFLKKPYTASQLVAVLQQALADRPHRRATDTGTCPLSATPLPSREEETSMPSPRAGGG